ncbi:MULTISPECIES: hypothetical protein [Nitrosopumilus]|nr:MULTISPECIES: hypothetical protein [Nitrosopumilus]
MQVLQTNKRIALTSNSSSSHSSKLTWKDVQGLSWIFEDDW